MVKRHKLFSREETNPVNKEIEKCLISLDNGWNLKADNEVSFNTNCSHFRNIGLQGSWGVLEWGVEGSSHSSYLVHIVFFYILNFKKFLKATNSNIKTTITRNMVLKLLSSSLQG